MNVSCQTATNRQNSGLETIVKTVLIMTVAAPGHVTAYLEKDQIIPNPVQRNREWDGIQQMLFSWEVLPQEIVLKPSLEQPKPFSWVFIPHLADKRILRDCHGLPFVSLGK